MKTKLTFATLERLRAGESDEFAMTPNAAMALMCQITFALLIIFVMLFVYYRAVSEAEMNEAKGTLAHYAEKMRDMQSTSEGQAYEVMEKSLIDLQQQKLLRALDKVEKLDRESLSIEFYVHTAPDGQKFFAVDTVLAAGKISEQRFIDGCSFAKRNLPNFNLMAQDWLIRTLDQCGMTLAKPHAVGQSSPLITQNQTVVTEDNEVWLVNEVNQRLKAVNSDMINLQSDVVAELHEYYKQHPEALAGTEVYKLIKQYTGTPPEQQAQLIDLIQTGLHQNAKEAFARQGVPLLGDI